MCVWGSGGQVEEAGPEACEFVPDEGFVGAFRSFADSVEPVGEVAGVAAAVAGADEEFRRGQAAAAFEDAVGGGLGAFPDGGRLVGVRLPSGSSSFRRRRRAWPPFASRMPAYITAWMKAWGGHSCGFGVESSAPATVSRSPPSSSSARSRILRTVCC